MPSRIWGNVIAGVHFFPPTCFRHYKPRGDERKRLMRVPARPIAYCIVRQACLTLTALQACFNTMFRLGYASKRGQRGLHRPIGEVPVDFDYLLGVSRAITNEHQHLLMAFLALGRARY